MVASVFSADLNGYLGFGPAKIPLGTLLRNTLPVSAGWLF